MPGLSRLRVPAIRRDLADPASMGEYRARVSLFNAAVFLLIVLVARVLEPESMSLDTSSWLLMAGFVVLAAWIGWRGARMSDLTYLAAMLGAQQFGVSFAAHVQPVGSNVNWELALVAVGVIAALFCARTWHVVVQVLVSIAHIAWLVGGRQPPGTSPTVAVMIESGVLVVVVVVVRLLRDLSLATVREAVTSALTDPLTGLSNRRGFERDGARCWRQQVRQQSPLCVALIDIDHFKSVNDRHGHAGGDDVIRRMSQAVTGCVRGEEIVARLGGEEFVVMGQVGIGGGLLLAERVRRAVEQQLGGVTVSIGVLELVPTQDDDLPAALWRAVDLADGALYRAKAAGRNCVVAM